MVPVPLFSKKRPNGATATSSTLIWITPWLFVIPMMFAVGLVRIVAPKSREDWERYLRALSTLLTESLNKAVAYRAAGQTRHRCNTATRDRTRPTGAVRPGGKPGARRTAGRGRVKR